MTQFWENSSPTCLLSSNFNFRRSCPNIWSQLHHNSFINLITLSEHLFLKMLKYRRIPEVAAPVTFGFVRYFQETVIFGYQSTLTYYGNIVLCPFNGFIFTTIAFFFFFAAVTVLFYFWRVEIWNLKLQSYWSDVWSSTVKYRWVSSSSSSSSSSTVFMVSRGKEGIFERAATFGNFQTSQICRWALAKRMQHHDSTSFNIVECNMLNSFGHHVAWCCTMLNEVWFPSRTWYNIVQHFLCCHVWTTKLH